MHMTCWLTVQCLLSVMLTVEVCTVAGRLLSEVVCRGRGSHTEVPPW